MTAPLGELTPRQIALRDGEVNDAGLTARHTTMTPTQRLASLLLGEPLAKYVADWRRMGASWSQIAVTLDADTEGQVSVSRETLRLWYGADKRRTTATPKNVEEPK